MIVINQGESSPYVLIDEANTKLVIKGNSFVSNPVNFYQKVIEWGNSYQLDESVVFTIEIIMGYYSTSNIQVFNVFFRKLKGSGSGKIKFTFFLEEEEEEDLEETMLSLVHNTGIVHEIKYL
jgi:preprotein translocase subunit SecA